jgi:hypothetical protein
MAETETQSATNGQSPWDARGAVAEEGGDRPEIIVGAAFVGGLVLAQVLKRLGSDD